MKLPSEVTKTSICSLGYKVTRNVFMVFGNLYWEFLKTDLESIPTHNAGVILKQRQYSVYFCYNYANSIKRFIDYNTFLTQYKAFKILRDTHPDYRSDTLDDILKYDLTSIMIDSEHSL